MSESWIEKYNRSLPIGKQERTSPGDDFDVFIEHSQVNHVKVDTEKAWKTVLAKLKGKKSTSSISWVWKVAASILLVTAATFGVYNLVDPVSDSPAYITETTTLTKKTVSLPDGSMITMAQNSLIEYPVETFETNRTISFTGEGFFEITKSNYPFTVKTKGATVQVLGTSFGIDTRKNTRVTVANGLVSLQTEKQRLDIREGQTAYANPSNGNIALVETDPNELSWKTGKFEFEDTPLNKAFDYLNKYYDVTFTSDPQLETCKITVRFNQESLSSVTRVLGTILNAQSTVTDKEVKFSGKGCN